MDKETITLIIWLAFIVIVIVAVSVFYWFNEPFEAGAEHGYQYAQTHPNWISVKERLPEEVSEIHHCSADVLIGYFANGDNYQTTARYNCKEKVWYDADDWGEIDFPTHWMPLPQPPRKEENDNE